ncbi:MAG: glycosyltransferase [Acidobacteria bacterium]|nr:glycosyltransferase [Acidobacteriota bacterium]
MERPHILYLIDVLASTHGGAEGILLKIVKMLPQRYRCSVATFSPNPSIVPVDLFPCPVHLFPIQRMYDWRAMKEAARLYGLIRRERYSIVHTFFPASDLLGGVVAKLAGCPLLISSRRDMGLLRSSAHWMAYRAARGMYDQVHAVSESVRLFHIEQDRLNPGKVITIPNGADVDEIDKTPASDFRGELGLASVPVVVSVANIRPVKGIDQLVRTAAIVRNSVPEVRFLVIGAVQDSDYFAGVQKLASELGVSESVVFAGARTDVPGVLKGCNIFYLSSVSEGLSNAMLEAMACALPCVATEVGGNAELIGEQRCGYLTPSNDAEAAARRIIQLLQDPALAVRMGREGRQIVESRFSIKAMMNRLTGLYDALLEGAGSHTAVRSESERRFLAS